MPRIPINITPLPVPVGVQALNINQLFQLWSQFVEASIDLANVSFFIQGTVDPASDQGLFFNTNQNMFKVWSISQGKYLPISDIQVGDTKLSFVTGDDINNGWLVCDGRGVQTLTGISQAQKLNVETLFGVNGSLPQLAPPQSMGNLPANGSIASIPVPTITPAGGVIGGLPIGAVYDQGEVGALRDGTETLRSSTAALSVTTTRLRDATEQIRDAIAGATANTDAVWKVFVGYP